MRAPELYSEGPQTNPTTSTVMADTGAVSPVFAAECRIYVIVGANAPAAFVVQRRNAANDANVGAAVVVYATGSGEYLLSYKLEGGERLRVMMQANLTGTAAASIFVERIT